MGKGAWVISGIYRITSPDGLDKGNNVFNKDNGKLKKTPAIWDAFVNENEEYFDVVCTWIEHTGIVNVIVKPNGEEQG